MLQMGGDFGFGDANAWFKNLDILLEAVNAEGRVNVSEYLVRLTTAMLVSHLVGLFLFFSLFKVYLDISATYQKKKC